MDCFNNFTTPVKHTSFLEINNSYGRKIQEKHCFEDFAVSQITWGLSLIYPIAIDNHLKTLFIVVSENQIPWMSVGFTKRWLLLPLRSLKVSVLLLPYMKTTFGRARSLAGPTFSGKKGDFFPLYSIFEKSWFHFIAPSTHSIHDTKLTQSRNMMGSNFQPWNGKHAQCGIDNTQCWQRRKINDF